MLTNLAITQAGAIVVLITKPSGGTTGRGKQEWQEVIRKFKVSSR